MTDVIIIIGLPASGKTTLGRHLSRMHDLPLYEDIDHIPEGQDRGFIADSPFFCNDSDLAGFKEFVLAAYPNANLTAIFFQNDPVQCLENAKRRKKSVDGLIRQLACLYQPPEHAIPVYKPQEVSCPPSKK